MKLSSFFLAFPLLGGFAYSLQSRDVSLAVRDSSSKSMQQVIDYVQIEETLIKMVRSQYLLCPMLFVIQ